jgi:hypothetical protein
MDKQDLGRFPTGHATHEPSRSVLALRVGIVSALLLLAGCEQPETYNAYWDHPQDSEVNLWAMERCLASASGPMSTQYNDWDEAIEACQGFADDVARYCPKSDMAKCLPQYRRTRESVRQALPSKAMETETAKTEGLGAKHDSAVAKPFAQGAD